MRYVSTMEPAASIVRALGGPSKVAEIVGVHRTRVSNWMRPRRKGGTGGVVPHWHVVKLLEFAQAESIDLTAANFAPVVPANTDATRPPAEMRESA